MQLLGQKNMLGSNRAQIQVEPNFNENVPLAKTGTSDWNVVGMLRYILLSRCSTLRAIFYTRSVKVNKDD